MYEITPTLYFCSYKLCERHIAASNSQVSGRLKTGAAITSGANQETHMLYPARNVLFAHRQYSPFRTKDRHILGACFCLLTYLGNAFNVDMFFGVNLLFGSIFVWLSMVVSGPFWALSAAFLGSLYTVELWGHWLAVILFSTEAVFVLTLCRFTSVTRLNFVVMLFWLGLGAPLAILLYSQVLALPWATVLLVAFKQALNGMLNAMVASFLMTTVLFINPKLSAPESLIKENSYSGLLQSVFGLAFLLPLLVSEFLELKEDFLREVDAELTRTEIEVRRSTQNIVSLLLSETGYWGAKIAGTEGAKQQETVKEISKKSMLLPPAQITSIGDMNDLISVLRDPIFSKNLQKLEILFTATLQKQSEILIGCHEGQFLSFYFSDRESESYLFSWSTETVENFIHSNAFEANTISCVQDNFGSAAPRQNKKAATVVRDTNPSIPTLRSWLGATIQAQYSIDSVLPSTITLDHALNTNILRVQQDTSKAIQRLAFLAALLTLGGQLIDFLFRRWVDKFALIAEEYLKKRQSSFVSVNANFTEDRIISSWLSRFAAAVDNEKQEKWRAEKNFGFFLTQSLTPVFATDADGRIKIWNPALQELTGFTEIDVLGRPISNFLKETQEAVAGNGKQLDTKILYDVATKNGRSVHLVVSKIGTEPVDFAPYTNSLSQMELDRSTSYFIAQNLGALKEAQAKLIHASRLAALGEMASSFAHELNQPLNVIALAAGGLVERAKSGDLAQMHLIAKAERIEAQALRAGALIQGIRNFVLKVGDEETSVFDPVEKTQSALDLVREQLRLGNVKVNVCAGSEAYKIDGRPILFEQAMVNLLVNAKQAMEEQSSSDRQIDITFTSGDQDLKIHVHDTGPGIPDQNLERVFEPFFSTKKDKGGSGVGLYMSRSVIEELNGTIKALSVNHGACFEIKFRLLSDP